MVCNFVFPKFALNVNSNDDDDDPVDALLQETTTNGTLLPSPNHLNAADGSVMMKDWELQEAVLGQYLIFNEQEDNFEAV